MAWYSFDAYIFASRLAKLRKHKKMTQDALAEEMKKNEIAGASREKVKFFESCERNPKVAEIVWLAQYFGVTTDYLLGLSDCSSPDPQLQGACEYTGLSESAITELNKGAIVGNDFLRLVNAMLCKYVAALEIGSIKILAARNCLDADKKQSKEHGRAPWPSDDSRSNSLFFALTNGIESLKNDADYPEIPAGTMLLSAKDAGEFYIDETARMFRDMIKDIVMSAEF